MQVHIYRYIDVKNEIIRKGIYFFLIRKTEGLSKCLKCTAAFESFFVVFNILLLCTIWFKFPTDFAKDLWIVIIVDYSHFYLQT